jgi:hypothetical protein
MLERYLHPEHQKLFDIVCSRSDEKGVAQVKKIIALIEGNSKLTLLEQDMINLDTPYEQFPNYVDRIDIENGGYYRTEEYKIPSLQKRTILEAAIDHRKPKTARALIESKHCRLDFQHLWLAVENNYLEMANALIQPTRYNPHDRNPHGCTPLITAVNLGKENIVRSFINRGADIHAKDKEGNTALHYAIKSRHIILIRLLLGLGSQIQSSDLMALIVLRHKAIERRQNSVAKTIGEFISSILATTSLDVNSLVDEEKKTALSYALTDNSASTVRSLLQRGVIIRPEDSAQMLAFLSARKDKRSFLPYLTSQLSPGELMQVYSANDLFHASLTNKITEATKIPSSLAALIADYGLFSPHAEAKVEPKQRKKPRCLIM